MLFESFFFHIATRVQDLTLFCADNTSLFTLFSYPSRDAIPSACNIKVSSDLSAVIRIMCAVVVGSLRCRGRRKFKNSDKHYRQIKNYLITQVVFIYTKNITSAFAEVSFLVNDVTRKTNRHDLR